MLPTPSPTAARDPRGMNRSRMRAHFQERNTSSTSLEGMERPVRSFKSFVQDTPPHPSPTETDKSLPSLPLTPAPWKTAHSREGTPTPPSAGHSSIISWRAPADWYNNGAAKTTPSPPNSTPRNFAPLIPEPSPGLLGIMEAERTAWLAPVSSPPPGRLLPIYERTKGSPDLGPPRTPPRSPLPATPSFHDRSNENTPPPEHWRANSSPSKEMGNIDFRTQSLSRADSDASTKEKAFASLGIESPDASQPIRKRADRAYLRGKKLQALCKGSPLADDSWEDEDMDDRTRELSFSQDYHDLLADQYQEMHVVAEEVLRSGGAHQVYDARFEGSLSAGLPKDHRDMVPRSLSWQKSSGQTTPRSRSHDGEIGEPSSSGHQRSRHKRLSSFLTHRRGSTEQNNNINNDDAPKKERRSSKSKQIPEPDVDKILDEDLRFSKFFPSSNKAIAFIKKRKHKPSTPKTPSSPPQASPLIRLPGGLAVVRTHSPSPSPAPKSDDVPSDDKSPTSARTRNSSQFGSEYSACHSYSANNRSSYNSHPIADDAAADDDDDNSPATVPVTMRSAYRNSLGSTYSQRSSASHPFAHDVAPPPPPPAPSLVPVFPISPPQSPPQSPDSAKGEKGEHRFTPRFFEKAKEARKRRAVEVRQNKLKQSIKVLGPTEVAGRNLKDGFGRGEDGEGLGRLPGYMVGGV